jgi:hypothetical protein
LPIPLSLSQKLSGQDGQRIHAETRQAWAIQKAFRTSTLTYSALDRLAAIDEFGGVANIDDAAARARAFRRVAENAEFAQLESAGRLR